MKRIIYFITFAALLILIAAGCRKNVQYKALIVTGQNTIDWQTSSTLLKQILEESGLFKAVIVNSPESGGNMNSFDPEFGKYDLVVLNYSGDQWSEKTKQDFAGYVNNGGGVVVYHAASSAFPGWKEYEEICGLTGWGGRTEQTGPYIYYNRAGRMVVDSTPGTAGWSGKVRDFEIRMRNPEHPVAKGLSVRWMHPGDVQFARLRGTPQNIEILATAFCDTTGGGTGRDEPVLMTIRYGKGRVFHTTLGFPSGEENIALKCAGFITTLQRGAEWAVSGTVTQVVPPDFPSAAAVSVRTNLKIRTLDENIEGLENYEIGKSTRFYSGIQEEIRRAAGDKEKLLEIEKKLSGLLDKPSVTNEAKKLILRELSWFGTELSVPSIKKLQSVPELKDEADFALERMGIN